MTKPRHDDLTAVGIHQVEGIELADFFSLSPQELIAHAFHDPSVTAIWGESDQIAPEPYGRAYAASFPKGRFEPIAQAGHLPHLERPEQVLQAIRRFADETIPSATT